ncbi:MAG: histidine--tRNA ligase [Bacilli bacterium]
MINKKPLKGMQDVLPYQSEIRRKVQNIITDTFIQNGFLEISTPSLDSLSLLANSQGGDNEKIMFKVLKRGEKLNFSNINSIEDLSDMGLRYDLTLPLSRFYANNMNELPSPFKVFQIGNVWRGERPQRGRFRQFTQCDVDIIGDKSIVAEISLIKTIYDALNNIGFNNIEIKINNRILINEMIKLYNLEATSDEVMIILDKLDKISFEKACKEAQEKNIDIDNFKNIYYYILKLKKLNITDLKNSFKSSIVNDFCNLILTLVNLGCKIKYDPTLIRGMGYYTGTIFEVTDTSLNLSIAGGGRYDNLVGKVSGIDVPACGFSIGFERIILLLLEKENTFSSKEKIAIIFSKEHMPIIDKILVHIRSEQLEGKIVSLIAMKKNLKKQINDLNNLGYDKIILSKEFI